jgi:hypothetical protein
MTFNHLLVCIYSTLLLTHTTHGVSFNQIRSFFGATPYEQIVEKDYTLNPHGHIILKNIQGNILVKTGLDKRSVAVKAGKHASAQEHLDHMHVIEEEVSADRLVLRTTYDYEKVKGSIDYILTVPDDARIELSNDNGNVIVQDVQGSLLINIGTGDATIHNSKQRTEINVTQQGNIMVIRPTQPVQLSTNKGIVRVVDSSHSVGARAKSGKVEVKCKMLPEKCSIKLATEQGPITLHAPKTINCSLVAETNKGTVTSTQEITLDSATVKLNEQYWNKIKRTIKGSIGNPNAEIKMFCDKGNISINSF